jgi:phosphoglycolate phosphatase-like HAD superfamily hydrolase
MLLPGIAADITTALLDVDGTLVDSNDAHARAWVDALHEAGYDIQCERVRPLIGMGADQLLPALAPELMPDREPGKSIARRRGEIFKARYLAGLAPTRAARDLLLVLIQGGILCVAATSAKKDELDALLTRAGVADLIGIKSTADDAGASKPAPDIVHAALKRAGSNPHESVMIGDTKYDVAAAAKANVPTLALRCGGSSDDDLSGAAAIYDDPLALAAAIRIS